MFGFLFVLLRVFELLTLIPIWGILAYFVSQYQPSTPPDYILCLFIVALLATVYAFFTLLLYQTWGYPPLFVSILDLCFFGALIAGVVLLAPYGKDTNCIAWSAPTVYYDNGWFYGSTGSVSSNKYCMMIKAAYGLGIANVIMFFLSCVAALIVWRRGGVVVYEERRRRRSYV